MLWPSGWCFVMSRIANIPILVPADVAVEIGDNCVSVAGPNGNLKLVVHPSVRINRDGQHMICKPSEQTTDSIAKTGTVRSLIANMVVGVTQGFEKELTLVGVGYRAQAEDGVLKLALGFSHPIQYRIPVDVVVETPSVTRILVRGADKQRVGQVAADIRAYRPPEPYKGKGVRYLKEFVVRKEAKKKQ